VAAELAKRRLGVLEARLLGAVLNCAAPGRSGYGYYYYSHSGGRGKGAGKNK
jgi:hypothetical protein